MATGGGPELTYSTSEALKIVQEMYEDQPSFSRIPNGRETPLFKQPAPPVNSPLQLNGPDEIHLQIND